MKRNRHNPKRALTEPGRVPSSKARGLGAERAATPARRLGFRIAAVLFPLLLLVALEFGLRVAGYGYPTAFLLPVRHNGQAMLRENPRFGWRFFPRTAARTPRPLLFAANKPPGTVRVLVLGESAAMGDPEPAYGFSRQLECILQARHPGERVEVINAAMTAISSHAIREIARDCRKVQADFWVVYAGNNEVVGPFGAGTVFGTQAPGLATARFALALKRARIGQWASALAVRNTRPLSWEGMELFLGQQVCLEDPRLKNVYANFAANLAEVVKSGKTAGAKVIVASMAVNLRDSPPFGSLHRERLTEADRNRWEALFASGRQAETNGAFGDALQAYLEAGNLDGQHAELIYRRAMCELHQGQTAAAEKDFALARDLDTLRFRADSRLNEIVREVAASQQVLLVDFESECARHTQAGPVGDDLFWDHVHLNWTGNFKLAALIASELDKAWLGSKPVAPGAADSERDIARQLAFTDADQRRVLHEMRVRLQQPPFSTQSNFRTRDQALAERLSLLPKPALDMAAVYREALAAAPEDWVIHMNFAKLLEELGDSPGALAQWREVTRLVPHWSTAWLGLGHVAADLGLNDEAERYFLETLRWDPNEIEAMNELGVLALREGNHPKAQQSFLAALGIRPGYNPARINLALSMAKQGNHERAAVEYREVLRRDSNNVEARVDLGLLLAGQGKTSDALALYQDALRLRPDFVPAHMNAAKLQLAQSRHMEAISHYETVLQTRPDLAQAQLELGLAYAQVGKGTEALQRLAEAVRLKPDWADARFNYGIALAKSRRFAEAAEQFRTTLRLQPDHAHASRALEQALRKASER